MSDAANDRAAITDRSVTHVRERSGDKRCLFGDFGRFFGFGVADHRSDRDATTNTD